MSSIFASRETRTVEIPFDAPNTVTVRKLSARQLQRAAKTFFNSMVSDMQEQGGASAMREMQALFAPEPKADGAAPPAEDALAAVVAAAKKNPLNGMDRQTVIAAGLVAWSYTEPLTEATKQSAVDDLSEEAVEFIATEIMRLTKPSLFLTDEEKQAEQVKG